MRGDLGVARPEVQGDPGPEARAWGHGLPQPSGEAEEGGRIVGAAGLNAVG